MEPVLYAKGVCGAIPDSSQSIRCVQIAKDMVLLLVIATFI